MGTVRKEGTRHRAAVLERDRGICSACGVDTIRLWEWLQSVPLISAAYPTNGSASRGRMLKAWKYGREDRHTRMAFRRVLGRHRFRAAVLLGRLWGVVIDHKRPSLWEAHHDVSVSENGGGCGVDGLVTLCLRCHRLETAALAGRLARRPAKGIGRG